MPKKGRFDFTKKNKRSGKIENVGYLDLEQDEEQSRCSLYFYGDIVSATWESMSNETWFDSKKMQQYFNVEIEEKAAVAACASDFFEKYNNIPEALKGIDTKDIVDAVIAELENRNNAAAEAEKQRIEAEKQQILDDLYLYGM